MEPELLSVQQAAQLLGLSVEGVRARIHRGVLPAARVGRAYLIRRADAAAQAERWVRQDQAAS